MLGAVGVLGYDAVTQVAGAAPPPVVTTDYAAYPPNDVISGTGCTATSASGVLQGYRSYVVRAGADTSVSPFFDPGSAAPFAQRSLRRFQDDVVPGDQVVIRWDAWTPGCENLVISFPVKATASGAFDITDDQVLFRSPNIPPAGFRYCWSSTALGEACPRPGGTAGFELSIVVPQLRIVCGYQLDVIIGGPLEIVGPHGSYYGAGTRQDAVNLGLGTFNTSGPSMLIDAANGSMPCTFPQRIVVDKQWVGTGSQPPSNVPPGFQLVVTSSVSDVDASEFGRATCSVVGAALACDYRDAADPSVPQSGLLVNPTSLLTVTETAFDGNTVDVTFPVALSSQFVTCPDPNSPCQFTITNTPPPPPPPPPANTTVPPTTTIPPADTSIVPPPPPAPAVTLPPTLPATGSPDATPLVLFGLVLVPFGVLLVAVTRRRASAD